MPTKASFSWLRNINQVTDFFSACHLIILFIQLSTMTAQRNHIVYKNLPVRLAQITIFIAFAVLIGWVFNISFLKRILPDFVFMNPTTAVLFIVCGLTLWFHQLNGNNRKRNIVDFSAWFIIIIATIRLAGFRAELDTGIDQFFFTSQLEGNRMAPNTALNFLFTGVSLCLLNRGKRYAFVFSQIAALLALAISLLAIIGYLYVDRSLYKVATFIPMALHTAITFFFLTTGILFAGSLHGVMSVITHRNIGGRIARILLPITLLIPILFGWLRLEAQRRGLVTLEFGTALMAISIISVFTVLIWRLASSINRTEEKRKLAEEAMVLAKQEAEEAKKTQEQFLANMSHEIRTPINGVIGMAQLIATTKLSLEQKEYMDIINESAANLLVIINDILDVTKMKVGKIALEEVNYSLHDTIRSLVKIFNFKTSLKGIALNWEIDKEIPKFLSGDPVRLNQILTNLINNAIKFTEKGEVKLSVGLMEEDDKSVTLKFVVQDTGIGIAEDKIESVFESFTQASTDTTRKYGGTGLGLTISKQLIELQGGSISLSSKPGVGSVFSFFLPVKKAIESITPDILVTADVATTMDQINILLAEDNLINQKVASKLLFKKGAVVDIANNGSEVLDMLAKKTYDVILMDINMPVLDGFETTQSIRQNQSAFQKIPIIALTASALASEKAKCLQAGMDDYLSKPFKAEELFEKISAQL